MDISEIIKEARLEKQAVTDFIVILHNHNPHDHYWEELLQLSKEDDFFEPCSLQYWIGKKFAPQNILEIGTRTGGSLIALLASYSSFEQVRVVSFDLWKENSNAIGLGKIPLIRWVIRLSPFNKILGLRTVKKNLRLFNIPVNIISFISGDSKNTVPLFLKKNQGQKFNYILVDGAHDAESASIDLENIASYVAPGGFLLFDDISPVSYNLLHVWINFKKKHMNDFDFYHSMHRKGLAWAIKK
jgi:predicted O-methyltransferase YrrM